MFDFYKIILILPQWLQKNIQCWREITLLHHYSKTAGKLIEIKDKT
jgi:hypothetical protein